MRSLGIRTDGWGRTGLVLTINAVSRHGNVRSIPSSLIVWAPLLPLVEGSQRPWPWIFIVFRFENLRRTPVAILAPTARLRFITSLIYRIFRFWIIIRKSGVNLGSPGLRWPIHGPKLRHRALEGLLSHIHPFDAEGAIDRCTTAVYPSDLTSYFPDNWPTQRAIHQFCK